MIKIIGFTGSLRKKSYNKAALNAAKNLVPNDVIFEIVDLEAIPFFSEDLEAQGLPDAVAAFKEKLAEADAVLIATPEYNYSIPPVLKNALDWASRGSLKPLEAKSTAIMSASIGLLGGARVQYHLRQVCVSLNMKVLNKPEVFISQASKKFDENGELIDEKAKQLITDLLVSLTKEVISNK